MNLQTVSHNNILFVNISNPQEMELKHLRQQYGFDPLHLDDYIGKTQVPKIEEYKNYNLLVLDFPFFSYGAPQSDSKNKPVNKFLTLPPVPLLAAEKKKRLFSSQVDFFIGKEYLVVLHDGSLHQIDEIFSRCQKTIPNRNKYMGQNPVFLAYKIIDALVDSCFTVINDLGVTIDKIDKALAESPSEKTLEDVSITRRNIVVFHTMIKPLLPIFKQLEDGKYKKLNGEMQPYWSNILDHLQKIWDRLEDSRELIEGISESNESLLVIRSNEVIKVLTLVFTFTIPATVLGTFYGMNVLLPGGVEVGHWTFLGPYTTFFVIIIFSIVSVLLMLLYFKYKKWF